MVQKAKSIFDYINDLFINKPKWSDYSQSDQKGFNIFMINRWVSMHIDFIEVINYLQQYTVGFLRPSEVFKLYRDILPSQKFFVKYTKADQAETEKYSNDLIELLCTSFYWNKDECIENLKRIPVKDLIVYVKNYGYTDDEIKKKFKLKI